MPPPQLASQATRSLRVRQRKCERSDEAAIDEPTSAQAPHVEEERLFGSQRECVVSDAHVLKQALFDDGLDELRAVEVARKSCHADPGDSSDLRQRHLLAQIRRAPDQLRLALRGARAALEDALTPLP